MGFSGPAGGNFSRVGGWVASGAAMGFAMAVSKMQFSFAKDGDLRWNAERGYEVRVNWGRTGDLNF
jgi:hypothetical protein